jgi:hypothetical protein
MRSIQRRNRANTAAAGRIVSTHATKPYQVIATAVITAAAPMPSAIDGCGGNVAANRLATDSADCG